MKIYSVVLSFIDSCMKAGEEVAPGTIGDLLYEELIDKVGEEDAMKISDIATLFAEQFVDSDGKDCWYK